VYVTFNKTRTSKVPARVRFEACKYTKIYNTIFPGAQAGREKGISYFSETMSLQTIPTIHKNTVPNPPDKNTGQTKGSEEAEIPEKNICWRGVLVSSDFWHCLRWRRRAR